MPYKIAVIYSAYPEISEAAHELIKQKGYQVEVQVCVFDEAVRMAKKYEAGGFDLIISRGATGTLIQRAVAIPVILVEITNFDILRTLYRARRIGEKVAYFHYVHSKGYYDFAAIRQILGLDEESLTIYQYRNQKELKEKVIEANARGEDVVAATGAFVLDMARPLGMKTIMVHSTREAIYNAFKQAEDILQVRNQNRDVSGYLTSLLDHLNTGVIVVNGEGVITQVNSSAVQVLGAEGAELAGKKADQVASPFLKEVIAGGSGSRAGVIGRHEVMASKFHLTSGARRIGSAVTLENMKKIQGLEDKIRKELYARGLVARYTFDDIVGGSQSIQHCITRARSYSRSDSTILISGESGTGKEVFANSIHNAGLRAKGPFVAVNCAALPESLLESELFGYDEGAFTGARKGGKPGLFELAHGGTIFLDEISEISPSTQARLLRVLQEKVIRRVGGEKIIPVDVRVIAATNAELLQKVQAGQFREDLYFRLNVLNLKIPPLRDRREDIPELVDCLLKKNSGMEEVPEIPDIFMARLQRYHWPGNVRELGNFAEKFSILSRDETDSFYLLDQLYQDLQHFEARTGDGPGEAEAGAIMVTPGTLREMELQLIEKLRRRFAGDKSSLAQMLGISRSNLWSKLKDLENGKPVQRPGKD